MRFVFTKRNEAAFANLRADRDIQTLEDEDLIQDRDMSENVSIIHVKFASDQ